MGIGPVAPQLPSPIAPARLPVQTAPVSDLSASPVSPAVAADSVGLQLQSLLTPQISDVLNIAIQSHLGHAGGVQELIQAIGVAATQHDVASALTQVTSLVQVHPEELESLRTQPLFAPIQAELDTLLHSHVATAHAAAQDRFSAASHAVNSVLGDGRVRTVDGPQVLSVAERLIESGTYSHLLISTELSQVVLSIYSPVQTVQLAIPASSEDQPGNKTALGAAFADIVSSATALHRRMPLLFMLLAWLALGLMSGALSFVLRFLEVEVTSALTFEIWGAGSAGLLGYGTYRRLVGGKDNSP